MNEPKTVPSWMFLVGAVLSLGGFFAVLVALGSGEKMWIGFAYLCLFAGGYSMGLADGWKRAGK